MRRHDRPKCPDCKRGRLTPEPFSHGVIKTCHTCGHAFIDTYTTKTRPRPRIDRPEPDPDRPRRRRPETHAETCDENQTANMEPAEPGPRPARPTVLTAYKAERYAQEKGDEETWKLSA